MASSVESVSWAMSPCHCRGNNRTACLVTTDDQFIASRMPFPRAGHSEIERTRGTQMDLLNRLFFETLAALPLAVQLILLLSCLGLSIFLFVLGRRTGDKTSIAVGFLLINLLPFAAVRVSWYGAGTPEGIWMPAIIAILLYVLAYGIALLWFGIRRGDPMFQIVGVLLTFGCVPTITIWMLTR